jgi:uncharacterized protein YecE (DUF72 family)
VGTAGWSIPRQEARSFAAEGSALERYASRFRALEINSSFHRAHRPATWAKWAGLVPEDFRFAVKIPKTITHERMLVDCEDLLTSFCDEVSNLGSKLAVLLVQLPPKLTFDAEISARFFAAIRSETLAQIVCEPRHASWFDADAEALLARLEIARVAADPAPVAAGASPGGWRGVSYWRLHGSPHVYRSPYGADRLAEYAATIEHDGADGEDGWIIFDNTASSAATSDALKMREMMSNNARTSHL